MTEYRGAGRSWAGHNAVVEAFEKGIMEEKDPFIQEAMKRLWWLKPKAKASNDLLYCVWWSQVKQLAEKLRKQAQTGREGTQ